MSIKIDLVLNFPIVSGSNELKIYKLKIKVTLIFN